MQKTFLLELPFCSSSGSPLIGRRSIWSDHTAYFDGSRRLKGHGDESQAACGTGLLIKIAQMSLGNNAYCGISNSSYSEVQFTAVRPFRGTGAIALRLARLGLHVTLLDAPLPMLDFAKRAAREAGVTDRIALKHGDAAQFANLFQAGSFDVILCHNILEYVDDPCAVLRSAARALRDASSIISVLVRNQAGEVLKAAIQDGDLAATEHNLTAEWGHESLYGGRVRLFTAESLQAMLFESLLAVTAERGVRVMSDYLPPRVSRIDEYKRILELAGC